MPKHPEFIVELDPASVPADIYRVKPPKVLFRQNGTITEVHAAYIEPESGEEIPVGIVAISPYEHTIYDDNEEKNYTSNATLVEGKVGDSRLYQGFIASAFYDRRYKTFRGFSGEQTAKNIKSTKYEARAAVLGYLGLKHETFFERLKKKLSH
jgi:hypothetical protein